MTYFSTILMMMSIIMCLYEWYGSYHTNHTPYQAPQSGRFLTKIFVVVVGYLEPEIPNRTGAALCSCERRRENKQEKKTIFFAIFYSLAVAKQNKRSSFLFGLHTISSKAPLIFPINKNSHVHFLCSAVDSSLCKY